MKQVFIAFLCGLAMTTVFAKGEDIERCLYNNGQPMDQRVCDTLRKKAAQDAAAAEKHKERMAAERALHDEQQAQAETKRQEVQREQEAKQAERRAKQEEQNATALKAQQEQIQWEKATAKAASERTAKQKAICGDDYKSMRVGMTLDRAKECVADFKLKGQINRADGVVSTYRAGPIYLHVMDGKIVSWGK